MISQTLADLHGSRSLVKHWYNQICITWQHGGITVKNHASSMSVPQITFTNHVWLST